MHSTSFYPAKMIIPGTQAGHKHDWPNPIQNKKPDPNVKGNDSRGRGRCGPGASPQCLELYLAILVLKLQI